MKKMSSMLKPLIHRKREKITYIKSKKFFFVIKQVEKPINENAADNKMMVPSYVLIYILV